MANSLITPSIIAKEALVQLENNLTMSNNVHREYKKEFVKVGDTVSIRKPVKFYAADGKTRVNQDVEEANTSITVDKQKHISWKFSSKDLTLTVDDYSERYIKPAMIALANTMDRSGHALYSSVWNHVGTPGSTPANFAAMAAAAQRMDEMAVSSDMRKAVMNPAAGYAIAGTAQALYMNGVNNQAYRKGAIGEIAGLETFRTQNVSTHTVGAHAGTPVINGASQETTYALSKSTNSQSLVTDGWSNSITGVLKAGDVITIAGVYAMNPVPGEGASGKLQMPYLQEFTILADADSGASTGPATLTISPAMIVSGPYQTVSAGPADGAAIVVKTGTASTAYPQNLAFHKNAFALVTCPLELPDGVDFKARETHKGLSARVVKQYSIDDDDDIIRIDILYGWKAIYPDLAVRITG
jgi:hypothetical protein